MAINLPIISEWNPKGIDKAIADFKKLETKGEKASFAIQEGCSPGDPGSRSDGRLPS
jgi:hypothetical protein